MKYRFIYREVDEKFKGILKDIPARNEQKREMFEAKNDEEATKKVNDILRRLREQYLGDITRFEFERLERIVQEEVVEEVVLEPVCS